MHSYIGTMNRWNNATAPGTGYQFVQAYAGVTSTDTTNGGGTLVFEVLGNGSIDVGIWNGSVIGTQYGGLGGNFNASSGIPVFTSGSVSVTTTLPNGINIGAATASSLLVTGTLDGQVPVAITTGSTANLGSVYNSGYTFNQNTTAAQAITYTLPTPVPGKQYCVKNSTYGAAQQYVALSSYFVRSCLCLHARPRSPKTMKIFTGSPRAIGARRATMEFLLINHPLDCPICDQGGECELQDLAVGFGRDVSRFHEEKARGAGQNLGPLIATDMTRCIQCTRCVRFTEEIAGIQELGMIGRGEGMKVRVAIEQTVGTSSPGTSLTSAPWERSSQSPPLHGARLGDEFAALRVAA